MRLPWSGGYASAILATRYGVSFWLCLPLSGLVSAALGALIGWPVLRLKGVYFAMTTLSLTEAIRLLALNGGDLTKGATGIVNIPRPGAIRIFGLTIVPEFNGADPLPFYFLACALLVLGLAGVWRLSTSRLGWVFRSLRQNEDLATSIGINVAKYRVIAFGVCCFMGGIGGAFFAVFHQNIYPATYTISDSVNFMLYCFLGGLSYIFGPVVGAFLLVIAFELLHAVQDYQALIYGVLMIVCMLWLPNGILSLGLRPEGKRRREGLTMAILDVQGITKRFGGLTAVNSVSFSVEKGAILSVIGPNGAGKSTLFKLISSFVTPTSGRVNFDGQNDHRSASRMRWLDAGVVRTFQETTIFKEMTALQNVIVAHQLRCSGLEFRRLFLERHGAC